MKRPKPLADYVQPCLGTAIAAQGFTGSDVLMSWPEIVGERLGAVSLPLRVEWPRRSAAAGRDARPDPATLIIRVEGAFALELQHLAPVLIERVNAFYGWRCIGRLVLKQAPVRRPTAAPRRVPDLSEDDRLRISQAVAQIDAEPLRAALARLGHAVAADGAAEGTSSSGTSLPQFS